ncbi:MAG: T9SS type A sorting domain-containing protein [Bacteroidota bacterium]
MLRLSTLPFPIAYDPCVCKNIGAFRVSFNPISYLDINLQGRIAATSQSPAIFYNGGPAQLNDYLLDTYRNNNGDVLGGVQLQSDAEKVFDAYKQELIAKGYDEDVAKLEVLENILEFGAATADLQGATAGLVSDNEATKTFKFISTYYKFLAKGIKFYKGSLKLKKIQNVKLNKTPPAIIRGGMTLTGTVVGSSEQIVTEFAVPGSKGSSILPETNFTFQPYYPLYNEELGIFALLETPTVHLAREIKNVVTPFPAEVCAQYQGETFYTADLTQELSYRLATDIKYAINPAAKVDLENSKILAALEIRTDGGFEYTGNNGNLEPTVDDNVFISPFVPIECLEDLTLYLERFFKECEDDPLFPSNPAHSTQVFLRFSNTYMSTTRGRDGLPVISQEVLTYPVKLEVVNSVPTSPKIAFNVNLSGNVDTDVQAWREINLIGNVTTSTDVTLTAGDAINIDPDVELPPGFTLETGINLVTNCGSPSMPYDSAQLEQYCVSNQYKANQASKSGHQYTQGGISGSSPTKPADFELSIQPNPITENTTLTYEIPDRVEVSLGIYDIQGKELIQLIDKYRQSKGMYELSFDGSRLSPGYYLVKLTTPYGQKVQKILKQ